MTPRQNPKQPVIQPHRTAPSTHSARVRWLWLMSPNGVSLDSSNCHINDVAGGEPPPAVEQHVGRFRHDLVRGHLLWNSRTIRGESRVCLLLFWCKTARRLRSPYRYDYCSNSFPSICRSKSIKSKYIKIAKKSKDDPSSRSTQKHKKTTNVRKFPTAVDR